MQLCDRVVSSLTDYEVGVGKCAGKICWERYHGYPAHKFKGFPVRNHHPKPFLWTKTADEILASVSRFCKRISNSGHSCSVP